MIDLSLVVGAGYTAPSRLRIYEVVSPAVLTGQLSTMRLAIPVSHGLLAALSEWHSGAGTVTRAGCGGRCLVFRPPLDGPDDQRQPLPSPPPRCRLRGALNDRADDLEVTADEEQGHLYRDLDVRGRVDVAIDDLVGGVVRHEAKRLRETADELYERRLAVLFELYLRTGLRCGEALGLYPSDFNLDSAQPTVQVSRSWSTRGYGPTKGKKIRVVPLAPSLAARVDELLCERGLSPRSETEHPFSAKKDTSRPLSPNQVLKLVKRAGKTAETRPVHTHMLRHTFGTECARRGVPLLTIKEWMGHAKVATTMQYLHLVAPDHFQWANLLPE